MQSTTIRISIFIAGDAAVARQTCREFCMARGECVTVTPTEFIYTGGQESGVIVGFINYPRFPRTVEQILKSAHDLAQELMGKLCQHSYSIEGPEITEWVSRRGEKS